MSKTLGYTTTEFDHISLFSVVIGQISRMPTDTILLGVDGGGTRCRARLCTAFGARLADAVTGPANIRLGFKFAMIEVMSATEECLDRAGLSKHDLNRITACLALAGASEPT